MTKYAIQVENLGKEYIIGGAEQRHESFREMLTGALTAPFRKLRKLRGTASEEERFWALKDVSFEVGQGEVLGIIGRNGAGKSTLLKVLSRITSPTEGRVVTRGRVASLLEVGTGFHPELTGRENVFLNGAILGMSRGEIQRRFDEIVAFAEIDRFLDTPVKRYSSGMYVRLAFSVAAHMEPEILLVDEVLAVGDAEFQKRCLGKMSSVAGEGRTVLFVSHNMSAINTLCTKCIELENGMVKHEGSTNIVISNYNSVASANSISSFKREGARGTNPRIESMHFEEPSNSAVELLVTIWSPSDTNVSLDIRLSDLLGNRIGFGSLGLFSRNEMVKLHSGENHIQVALTYQSLAVGSYRISADLAYPFAEYLDRVENCLCLEVNRVAETGASAVLLQSWGLGSQQLDLERMG